MGAREDARDLFETVPRSFEGLPWNDGFLLEDVMEPTKFLGKSRAFAAMWMPVLAMILRTSGYGADVFGQVELAAEALLTLGGVICWFLHWLRPDPRQPVLRTAGPATALALVLLVGLSGPLLTGCATFGDKDATPEQKLLEAERATIVGLELVRAVVNEIGPDKIPPEVGIAIVEAAEAIEAIFPEVRAWVTACKSDGGCDTDTKVRLAVSTAKAMLNESLEKLERICAARPDGCESESKVRLALVSTREAVDLVGRIVAEAMSDGE